MRAIYAAAFAGAFIIPPPDINLLQNARGLQQRGGGEEIALGLPADVRQYGAVCDGVTSDDAALASALTAQAGKPLHFPEGMPCHITTTGITVPAGTTIFSYSSPLQNPAGQNNTGGAIITCAAAVATCVTMTSGTSGISGKGAIRTSNMAIVGSAAGTGLLIKDTYNAVLDNTIVQNFSSGIVLQSDGIYGISARFSNTETCQITNTDLTVNSWPELRIDMMRFGCNNDGVERSGSYVLLEGGTTGPNTLMINNSQFNAGGGGANCWVKFASMGPGFGGIISEFTFANNHLESNVSGESGVCSDATVTGIFRFIMTGNIFLDNTSANQFWSLNSATAPNDWVINDNVFISWAGWNLAPATQFNKMVFNGNDFENTSVSLTGTSNSTVLGTNNMFNNLTLGGSFLSSKISGINLGSLTNTATGITVSF